MVYSIAFNNIINMQQSILQDLVFSVKLQFCSEALFSPSKQEAWSMKQVASSK